MTLRRVANDRPLPSVEKDRLLLVEGRDEVNLIEAVVGAEALRNVQLIDAAGKDNFRGSLANILLDAQAKGIAVRSIGIVRDADLSSEAASSQSALH